MKRIPIKLDNCPIVESVLEFRFDSHVAREVVFPILFSSINSDFQSPIALPTLQIPDSVKAMDPNLKDQPSYRLLLKENPNFSLQIGPRVVSFSFNQNYRGWDAFQDYVISYFTRLKQTNIINRVTRMGFRVINFFEWDIFKRGTEVSIFLQGKEIPYRETTLRTKFINGDYQSVVNIINNAQLNSPSGKKTGSIIDIDTCLMNCENFFQKLPEYMGKAHSIEKEIFFNLLNDDLIESFKPSYNDSI
ncbi:MAG: TIGR04255 family protein [Bacteroidales bacterium]|nr:TIGR04255 family protein [Bacteroidales bacterium]